MIKLFLLSFVFLLSIVVGYGQKSDKISKSEIVLPEKGFCAHRGAMGTHPENTIPAFKAAVKAGAHMVEMDVWLTKDKKMVVLHDATVDRTTNGTGKVSDLTLAELKILDAGSWKSPEFKGVQIPTFEEALAVMPRNIWLNIHVKGEKETPVMAAKLLKEKDRLHQAFLACGAEAAKNAKELVPSIKICNMERQEANWDYVNATVAMKADFIQLRRQIIPEFEDFVRVLKENGIRINYFGTDSHETLKLLFQYGFDFPLVNDIVHTVKFAESLGIDPVIPVY